MGLLKAVYSPIFFVWVYPGRNWFNVKPVLLCAILPSGLMLKDIGIEVEKSGLSAVNVLLAVYAF